MIGLSATWAWERAIRIPGLDPSGYRLDDYGALIRFTEYGQLTRQGWQVDHRRPTSEGGTDILPNLRALQWENNEARNAKSPIYVRATPAELRLARENAPVQSSLAEEYLFRTLLQEITAAEALERAEGLGKGARA